MELILKAYYGLIEDCQGNPDWIRKIEEDIGQSMSFMAIQFDESVRDDLVAKSEIFRRFVSIFKYLI